MTAALDVQRALVATLLAAPAVAALAGTRVFDHVPRRVAFPFVSLRLEETADDGTKTGAGLVARFEITCWSRRHGAAEALELAGGVVLALDRVALPLGGGWRWLDGRVSQRRVTREDDHETVRVPLAVRLRIEAEQPITE
ncbi:DUF3168 domain-containing protein [Zavarzinia sp. CC-PAN008]|uniref:DUF3168 domain-containing protein n=1 Tax=Zavarzinia sp. CC-PAN008 TaxID=3243332 RepID=UPI003F7480D5